MRIALDVMGGDKAPEAIVAGAVEALNAYDRDLQKLFLVGDEATVKRELDRLSYAHSKIEIIHASEIVTMHDSAVKSVRQKKDSSISVAVDLVKRGDADGVVSAGNTGAAVAAATIKWRNIP